MKSENLELTTRDPNKLAAADATPMSLIERAAFDPNFDVAKLQALMQMRREWEGEQAKKAFDKAMAAFQAECPVITKAKAVVVAGQQVYSYAPLEYLVTVIKPLLQKHGFVFTWDTDVHSDPGWVIAHCDVKHSSGHMERKTAKFPLGTGTKLMSTTQVYSAALTFAQRRVLGQAFGLVFAGEDLDGMVKKGRVTSTTQDDARTFATLIWEKLQTVRGTAKPPTWQKANEWLWREEVIDSAAGEEMPNLPIERLKAVLAKVEELEAKGALK